MLFRSDFELVVVDDASTDNTLAMLRAIDDPRVRVIASEQNGGPIAARNRAFEHARGRYIAGLDQDDLCHPERLKRQVAYMDAHPDVVLAATAVSILQDDGRVEDDYAAPAITSPALIEWMMLFHNPLTWSSDRKSTRLNSSH